MRCPYIKQVLDSVIYLLLTWYLYEVMPSQYGTSKPIDFCFEYSFWFPSSTSSRTASTALSWPSSCYTYLSSFYSRVISAVTTNGEIDDRGRFQPLPNTANTAVEMADRSPRNIKSTAFTIYDDRLANNENITACNTASSTDGTNVAAVDVGGSFNPLHTLLPTPTSSSPLFVSSSSDSSSGNKNMDDFSSGSAQHNSSISQSKSQSQPYSHSHSTESETTVYPAEAAFIRSYHHPSNTNDNSGSHGSQSATVALSSPEPTVVIRQLRKTYDDKLAVNHLSLSLYEHQIFVLLGHNGAGEPNTFICLFVCLFIDLYVIGFY